jgi:hypothetical protein
MYEPELHNLKYSRRVQTWDFAGNDWLSAMARLKRLESQPDSIIKHFTPYSGALASTRFRACMHEQRTFSRCHVMSYLCRDRQGGAVRVRAADQAHGGDG